MVLGGGALDDLLDQCFSARCTVARRQQGLMLAQLKIGEFCGSPRFHFRLPNVDNNPGILSISSCTRPAILLIMIGDQKRLVNVIWR